MAKQNIHVLGGARGIGRWFIENIYVPQAGLYDIYCYDYNLRGLSSLPNSVTKCVLRDSVGYNAYKKNFSESDWILFAIPLSSLNEALEDISGIFRDNSLLIPFTSVQEDAINLFEDIEADVSFSIVGCHPLFGDNLQSPVGQTVVLTRFENESEQHRSFKSSITHMGLLVSELNEVEHDEYMSIIQGLTHFTYLTFAKTLTYNKNSIEKLLELKTPNFQFLYAFTSRVLKLSSTTTGLIQSTTATANMRRVFIESAQTLHNELSENSDVKGCANIIEELRGPFTGKEVAEGVEVAALAVDSLQRIEELFHKYKRSGRPFVFKNKIGGKIHIVRITAVLPDSIIYEESTKVFYEEGISKYAFGINEVARENYRSMGYNLPNPRKETIKKRNIKLLLADEMREFYKKRVKPISDILHLSNPYKFDEEYFEQWLPMLIKGLWKCEFVEAYRRRSAIERVTIHILFNPNTPRAAIKKRIKGIIESYSGPQKWDNMLR